MVDDQYNSTFLKKILNEEKNKQKVEKNHYNTLNAPREYYITKFISMGIVEKSKKNGQMKNQLLYS